MKIIIVGEGTVGAALAERLTHEKHDVTVIDCNAQVLNEAQEELDIMTVTGNGVSLDTLREAGAEESDLLIAVTNADEINMLSCLSAKKLGCGSTIARVRDPEYYAQTMFLQEELGLSLAVNPDLAASQEIYRLIQFPSFLKRDTFAKGKVELVEVQLGEDSLLAGKTIADIASFLGLGVLVCAVERDNLLTIPNGRFVLQAKDHITLAAASRDLADLMKRLGHISHKIRTAMIIGCGRIAEYLTEALEDSGISVKLVDKREDVCEKFALQFPHATVVCGDATRRGFLESEGIRQTDAVITLTDVDEENLVISMFCSHSGVGKTVTKINRNEYVTLFSDRGIGSVVCPKDITAGSIIRYVRAMSNRNSATAVRTLHRIVNDKAEAAEFFVAEAAVYTDVPLSRLRVKPDVLLACISRDEQVIIPRGDDVIRPGDTVVVVTMADGGLGELSDIFEKDPVKE